MKIGYVRISKQEQNEALQVDVLKEAGCEKWFLDTLNKAHPALAEDRSWVGLGVYEAQPPEVLDAWRCRRLHASARMLEHLSEHLL